MGDTKPEKFGPQMDEVSLAANQYDTPFAARVRRAYMELGEGQSGLYSRALQRAGLRPEATVGDIGCGDGSDAVKLAIAGHTGRIIGVEVPYPQQLGSGFEDRFLVADKAIAEHGLTNVEFVPGYAQSLPFEDESIDALLYGSVLQHLKDLEFALKVEAKRVLVDGGKIIVIHNTANNKPFHHKKLREMGIYLGSDETPSALSSKFPIETESQKMRYQYGVLDDYTEESPIPINYNTLPDLLGSIDTYKGLFKPEAPAEKWLEARLEVVEKPVTEALARGETIEDLASRRILILEKKLTGWQIAHLLGFDAKSGRLPND